MQKAINFASKYNYHRLERVKLPRTINAFKNNEDWFKNWDSYSVDELKNTKSSVNPLYQLYYNMLSRCYNSNSSSFVNYGGAGITVCSEWRNSFSAFANYILTTLDKKPEAVMSIDRIDNTRGYMPGNIRWAQPGTQARNRSNASISHENALCIAYIKKHYKVSLQQLMIDSINEGWYSPHNREKPSSATIHQCYTRYSNLVD